MKEESTMPAASQGIRLLTAEDVDTWYRSGDRKIFLSDVLDPSNSESMSVRLPATQRASRTSGS
jgi:hypothetical protein